jgi:hypothetical protein
VGSADLGIGRSRGGPDRAGFCPGECQVGPKVGMGVFALFLSSYLMVVGPWIRVLALDWSRVCFFGLVRCHGHVGACIAARRHVAWCGSHQVHMTSCAHLSHPGSDACKCYIRLGRLVEPVVMVQTNLAFDVIYDDAISMPLVYLLSTISFHAYFDVSCNKR